MMKPHKKINYGQPSLFERLVNDEMLDELEMHAGGFKQFCESLRRDLQNLLNTKRACFSYPEELTELQTSLVDYGLVDFTRDERGQLDYSEDFCRQLERVIMRYEKRIKKVAVTLKNINQENQQVQFNIEALIELDQDKKSVVFNSIFEQTNKLFSIT